MTDLDDFDPRNATDAEALAYDEGFFAYRYDGRDISKRPTEPKLQRCFDQGWNMAIRFEEEEKEHAAHANSALARARNQRQDAR